MENRLSIITVTFNSMKTLRKTLESIREAKEQASSFEYIVIDGNSSDGTLELLREYKNSIDILISEKDHGVYEAMNKGIKSSSGDFLLFINSDDWVLTNNLNRLLRDENLNNVDIISCPVDIANEEGELIGSVGSRLKKNKKYYAGMPVFHQGLLVRNIGGEKQYFDLKYKIAADYGYLLRLLQKTQNIYCLDFPISVFRMGGISANRKQLMRENFKIERKYLGIVWASCVYIYGKMSLFFQKRIPKKFLKQIRKLKRSPFHFEP